MNTDDDGPYWRPAPASVVDALFARIRNGTPSKSDHELFDAYMLERFVARVWADEAVEPWILHALSEAFAKILAGGAWNDEIRLPGRPATPIRSAADEKSLHLYCEIQNSINRQPSRAVVGAIRAAAKRKHVSYGTARAAYYKWKGRLSKD